MTLTSMMSTLDAVREGKEKPFVNCFVVHFSFDDVCYLFVFMPFLLC